MRIISICLSIVVFFFFPCWNWVLIKKWNPRRYIKSNFANETHISNRSSSEYISNAGRWGALIQYQLVRRKREKTTTNNMRNINCWLSVSSFCWTLLCCVVAGATEPLSLGGQDSHEQQTNVNELTRLHSSLNYRAAHQYNKCRMYACNNNNEK